MDLPLETRWITSSDGVRLFVRSYRPPRETPHRTLLWCHGVGEHGGRHEHVVAEFLARGWQVIIPDLRGHGQSAGVRADVSSFEDYLNDFDLIAREFSLAPTRTALFGHSMGGLVMMRWAESRPRDWAALVLSAPLLGVAVPIPAWKWCLGRLLALVAPRTHLRTGISERNMTTDPNFLAARRADPLIQHSVTARWFFAMLDALRRAHADAGTLTLPILILQGAADNTTDPTKPAAWLQKTRSVETRLVEYPEGLHELLNDGNWRAVCAEMMNWLDERLPGVG